MSRIFISGINGFIGSNLAEKLLKEGHNVIGLVRKSSDLSFIEGMNIKLFYGDITNRPSLKAPMKNVDIVIHVAGFASDWGPYEKFYNINVLGTKNIAETAAENGVKRFVHISTVALHGFPNKRDLNESAPMADTIFPYNETKKIAEKWIFEFSKTTDMEITAIRPGNVYGPKDHTFIEKYLEALESGKGGYIDGGRHLTCPVYIENLVDGIIKSCFSPKAAGEAFIITDGLNITWKEFTEKLCEEAGIKKPKLSTPYAVGYTLAWAMESVYKLLKISTPPLLTRYRISNGGRDYHFSIEKARRILNYNPPIPFDEAIKRTVAWYRNSRKSAVQ
jgi:nucleoside-diphosphate-sugar epimerase